MKNKSTTIIMVIAGLIFITLSILLVSHNLNWLDTPIYNYISKYINDNTTVIMKIITNSGSAEVLVPLTLIISLLLYKRVKYVLYALMLIFTLITSDLLSTLVKHIFSRPRPDILRLVTENSYSFPSSHSLVGLCFYGYIIYMIGKIVKGNKKYIMQAILGLLVLSIGISRIYLGIHYASDVIAGFSLGFIWLIVCIYITKRNYKDALKK